MSTIPIKRRLTQAIILAGGDGIRIKNLFPNIPKPLIPFNDTPFIELLFDKIIKSGINKIYLAIIKKHIPFYEKYIEKGIILVPEDSKLGTGGAVKSIMEQFKINTCFVVNGDSFCDVNFVKLSLQHKKLNSDLTICVSKNNTSRHDAGNVEVDEENNIISFHEKKLISPMINSGVYIINKKIFESTNNNIFSLEKHISKILESYKVSAYFTQSQIYDFGTPERFIFLEKIITEIFRHR